MLLEAGFYRRSGGRRDSYGEILGAWPPVASEARRKCMAPMYASGTRGARLRLAPGGCGAFGRADVDCGLCCRQMDPRRLRPAGGCGRLATWFAGQGRYLWTSLKGRHRRKKRFGRGAGRGRCSRRGNVAWGWCRPTVGFERARIRWRVVWAVSGPVRRTIQGTTSLVNKRRQAAGNPTAVLVIRTAAAPCLKPPTAVQIIMRDLISQALELFCLWCHPRSLMTELALTGSGWAGCDRRLARGSGAAHRRWRFAGPRRGRWPICYRPTRGRPLARTDALIRQGRWTPRLAAACDVRNDGAVEQFFRASGLGPRSGRPPREQRRPSFRDGLLLFMSNEQWNEVVDTNLGGGLQGCIRAAVRGMMLRRWGPASSTIVSASRAMSGGHRTVETTRRSKAGLIGLRPHPWRGSSRDKGGAGENAGVAGASSETDMVGGGYTPEQNARDATRRGRSGVWDNRDEGWRRLVRLSCIPGPASLHQPGRLLAWTGGLL